MPNLVRFETCETYNTRYKNLTAQTMVPSVQYKEAQVGSSHSFVEQGLGIMGWFSYEQGWGWWSVCFTFQPVPQRRTSHFHQFSQMWREGGEREGLNNSSKLRLQEWGESTASHACPSISPEEVLAAVIMVSNKAFLSWWMIQVPRYQWISNDKNCFSFISL